MGCAHIMLYSIGQDNQVTITGRSRLRNTDIRIRGNNNTIDIKHSHLSDVTFEIYGNNHRVVIEAADIITQFKFFLRGDGHSLHIGKCKIHGGVTWMESRGCAIRILDFTTIEKAGLITVESDTSIHIGYDCMLSHDLTIRASDSHPIYDVSTRERINPPKDVVIGDHVWIGAYSHILKGVTIGENSVIGINSTVSTDIPVNSVAVGQPAKVVRSGAYWLREATQDSLNDFNMLKALYMNNVRKESV